MDRTKDLSFRQLSDLSFGFMGVQIAYALQSANVSRIFATLGADPHTLSYFWLLPPLAGMLVQPLIGAFSDRTWMLFGRRLPYLLGGAAVAVVILCLLPNAGSLGLAVSEAMTFGLVTLLLLDTSLNVAMQPFKMLVGDMVTPRQRTRGYAIQSFLCNAGSLIAYASPFILTWLGISNVALNGGIPDSVIYSFYAGAVILILCVAYTMDRVTEMPPIEYEEFHKVDYLRHPVLHGPLAWLQYLGKAPKVFWQLSVVQFFCWAAFLYLWTYLPGAVADNAFDTTDTLSEAYQHAANWTGVLLGAQALGAMLWSWVLPKIRSVMAAYSVSLLLGAIGFIALFFVRDQYWLLVPMLLTGMPWAAMLVYPFTLLTNAIEGTPVMGTYIGMFNCTICFPQIVAAAAGGTLLAAVDGAQPAMMIIAGGLLILGAITVMAIRFER